MPLDVLTPTCPERLHYRGRAVDRSGASGGGAAGGTLKGVASRDGSPATSIADAARFPRPVWASPRAYVLATITGVVGLGNIWRFPYMVGQHGGGSFVVAYLVCVVVMAVPLATLESASGKVGRRSPVGTLRHAAGRGGVVVGWAIVVVTAAILSYYLVITGWTFGYFLDSLRGDVRPFGEFTRGSASLWLFLAVAVLVTALLLRGMGAVERASFVVVPVLVLIVVGLAIYGQTLDGAADARDFYAGIRGDDLASPATWRAAAGQAFYSVGVGQGVLIAFGSFVPAGTNLVRSTATVAVTNALVSIVAGLMVFAFVFSFDISPDTGSELSFTAFPAAFAQVPGGAFLAVAFFSLLFVAGFTSCVGGSMVVASTVEDELGLKRRGAALVTVILLVVLGIPSALSFTGRGLSLGGEPFLDRVDQLAGTGVVLVLGLVGAAILARGLPRRQLTAAFGASSVGPARLRLGPRTVVAWAMLLPVVVAVLLLVGTIL